MAFNFYLHTWLAQPEQCKTKILITGICLRAGTIIFKRAHKIAKSEY